MLKYVLTLKDDASVNLKKFADNVSKADNGTSKLGGTLKATAGLAAGAVAGLAGLGAAYAGLALKMASTQDVAIKQSRTLGVSVEWLTAMGYAADQTGSSSEGLSKGLDRLSATISEAADGSASAQKTFDKLGVSIVDAQGNVKPTEQIFEDLAVSLEGVEDGSQKARIAQELFGRNNANLLGLMSMGKAGLEQYTAEAEKFGVVVGQDSAEAAERLGDAFDHLKKAMAGASKTAIEGSFDPLTEVMDGLADIIADNSGAFIDLGETITTVVKAALPMVSDLAKGAAKVAGGIKGLVSAVFDEVDFSDLDEQFKELDVKTALSAKKERKEEPAKRKIQTATQNIDYKKLAEERQKFLDDVFEMEVAEAVARAELYDELAYKRLSAEEKELVDLRQVRANRLQIAQEDAELILRIEEEFRADLEEVGRRYREEERLAEETEAERKRQLMSEIMFERLTDEERQLEELARLREARIEIAQGDKELLLEIEESYQSNLFDLQQGWYDQQLEAQRQMMQARFSMAMEMGQLTLSAMRNFGAEQKSLLIGEAILNASTGAAKALNMPFPASVAAWVHVASIGAKLVGEMKAVKMATGGDVFGASHAGGGVMRELEGGEAVIPKSTAKEFGGYEGIMNELRTNRGQNINITLVNPIGTKDYIQREIVPTLREGIRRL